MGCTERVLNEDVTKGGKKLPELTDSLRADSLSGLLRVEAKVFQQKNLPGLEFLDAGQDICANTVAHEANCPGQSLFQVRNELLERQTGDEATIGSAYVANENHGGAFLQCVLYSGNTFFEAAEAHNTTILNLDI
mmetsp:Transcript_17342/g.48771  ORF Transcript_17342/g.48771 Transcript_17342/m.48771 type:complete len:135 (-) Transcript_17342:88-492(-)